MATNTVTIRHRNIVGNRRVVIGDFTNATDTDGTIDTTLATVRGIQFNSPTATDRDCQIWRNSTDASGEYDASPTVAHLGGKVSYVGLTADAVYRFIAWGH